MGSRGSGRLTAAAVELNGTGVCRGLEDEDCDAEVSPLSVTKLCGTHHKRWYRWASGKPPALPAGVEKREAYPYRDWLYSVHAKTNTVHCQTRVWLVGDAGADGWVVAPLCNTEARLRPRTVQGVGPRAWGGWSSPPARCGRCEGILRRVGLLE